ncbi:MAG: nuclear transport factor 2 family protein [Pedobacter sp.]|nr:MAG: nuclear transport factor 2 family protein [Pedobacter sp.]
MTKKILYTIIAASITFSGYAQKSDGSTKSLVKAEEEFAESLAKNGTKTAYTTFAAADGLVFRPNPVNAKTFYGTQPVEKNVTWTPVYAKVSRSGDFGFTTGPFTVGGNNYGQYFSVWKAVNDKWELALDLGVSHNKPLNKVSTQIVEPKDHYKPTFLNDKQRATGAEIIGTTEETLNTLLKTHGVSAFAGFVNPDVRVLFPGYEPIIGKDKAVAFFNSMFGKVTLKRTKVKKADGGDLAYTYGVTAIDYKADLRESFNYVFVYERQPDAMWNLIAMVFAPAER